MKTSLSEVLKWLVLVFMGHYSRSSVNNFAQGYQSCYDAHALRSGHRNVNSMYYPTSSQHSRIKRDRPTLGMSMDENEHPTEGTASIENRRAQLVASPTTAMTNREREKFLDFPELEIIEFEGILNFRSALPGTGLPLYRCAALDNATASDTERLLNPETLGLSSNLDPTTR